MAILEENVASIIVVDDDDDGSYTFLKIICSHKSHTVSHPRRWQSSFLLCVSVIQNCIHVTSYNHFENNLCI
jgi:hypothetical protein